MTSDEQGSVIVEFALVAVLMFTLMLGILQYGYLFWSLETASAVAREAARSMSVGTDWPCVRDRAVSAAAGPAVGSSAPAVEYRYVSADTGAPLPGAVVGDLVIVTVSFNTLDMAIPLLPMPNGGVVEQQGSARIENIPETPLSCDPR